MINTEPTLPTINLNGTSASSLFEDYDNARLAIEEAATALSKIEFHARDYQVDNAWYKAYKERLAIHHKLHEVREFLIAHMDHLANA
jgi:hypothetical protein